MASKAVDATHRRTWDKDDFEKRAKERVEKEEEEERGVKRPGPPVERELLKQRDYKVDLDSRLGKSRVIIGEHDSAGGYFCNVCDCVIKDSINFLDHINGKKHQRNLGMSMKVERSTVSDVRAKLEEKKRKLADDKVRKPEVYDLDSRVAALQDEDDRRKKEKRDKQKQKKQVPQESAPELDGEDSEMAALMGFGGFSSSKK